MDGDLLCAKNALATNCQGRSPSILKNHTFNLQTTNMCVFLPLSSKSLHRSVPTTRSKLSLSNSLYKTMMLASDRIFALISINISTYKRCNDGRPKKITCSTPFFFFFFGKNHEKIIRIEEFFRSYLQFYFDDKSAFSLCTREPTRLCF